MFVQCPKCGVSLVTVVKWHCWPVSKTITLQCECADDYAHPMGKACHIVWTLKLPQSMQSEVEDFLGLKPEE